MLYDLMDKCGQDICALVDLYLEDQIGDTYEVEDELFDSIMQNTRFGILL